METKLKILERGFTLIELMIVIAIIGILSAIATFAYRDYLIRAQVAEGITLMTSAQLGLAEFYSAYGRLPVGGNGSVALPSAGSISSKYVASVAIQNGNGKIVLVFGHDANTAIAGVANECTFSPITSSPGAIHWSAQCGFPARYLPKVYQSP